jgi:hypothetical protein
MRSSFASIAHSSRIMPPKITPLTGPTVSPMTAAAGVGNAHRGMILEGRSSGRPFFFPPRTAHDGPLWRSSPLPLPGKAAKPFGRHSESCAISEGFVKFARHDLPINLSVNVPVALPDFIALADA